MYTDIIISSCVVSLCILYRRLQCTINNPHLCIPISLYHHVAWYHYTDIIISCLIVSLCILHRCHQCTNTHPAVSFYSLYCCHHTIHLMTSHSQHLDIVQINYHTVIIPGLYKFTTNRMVIILSCHCHYYRNTVIVMRLVQRYHHVVTTS